MNSELRRLTIAEYSLLNQPNPLYLVWIDLSYVYLWRVDLEGANLVGATLTGSCLSGAKLAGANLASAILNNADLTSADLSHTNLIGASFVGAKLESIIMLRAAYDASTKWPAGYDPRSAGAVWIK